MAFERYSAVPIFGIPIENERDVRDPLALISLMGRYGISGQEVPSDITDITPYYWPDNPLRYFVSLEELSGPVVLDIMPAKPGALPIMGLPKQKMKIIGVNTLKIPDNAPAFALPGKSPRYGDDITCVHELIVHRP